MNFERIPVTQWKHRQFDATDPWARNQPTRWGIVVYRLVAKSMLPGHVDEQSVPSEANDVPKKYYIGIHAEQSGRYRLLPGALANDWRAGQVQDQDLPRLLYQGEAPLRRENDEPGPLSGRPLLHAWLIGVAALGIFACYLCLVMLSSWK